MNVYVLTQMEIDGEGEQSHVATRNRGVTFDPEKAVAWAGKGVDYDYDTLPLLPEESAQLGASQQIIQALHDAIEAAKELGVAADEASHFVKQLQEPQ